MNDCTETPVLFGSDSSLVGIITSPAEGPRAPVACLMLNMGATHRIGPRRVNVKLARQLAARGVSSIRFDLAGLGDSRPASGAEHFRAQNMLDMQAAMDLIGARLGVHRFIVIGLCSGGGNGLWLANSDARVVGILMFETYAFPSRRTLWERSARRALAAPTNPAVLGKTLRWLQRKVSAKAAAARSPEIFEAESPDAIRAFFRRSMRQIMEREVAVLFLYSGTTDVADHGHDQLANFADEPFMKRIDYHFDAAIDHNLSTIQAQQTFMQFVCDWTLRVIAEKSDGPLHVSAGRPAPAVPIAPSSQSSLERNGVILSPHRG